MLTISVVVPVHNGGESFKACLQKLLSANPAPQEVIVVADADTDGSAKYAEDMGVQVIRIFNQSGPAKARNEGAKIAKGDIIFFVDADVVIPHDAIAIVTGVFTKNHDIAALFGSYDDDPGEKNFLSQYRNLLHHYVHQTGCEEASTFWSGCGAIRRSVFEKVKGFNECYTKPAVEDIELGYTIRHAGHKIVLHKTLQAKHLKRWEAKSVVVADFFYRAVPWTELILAGNGFVNDLNLNYSNRISVVSSFLLVFSILALPIHFNFLYLTFLSISILTFLNYHLYYFFFKKRGLVFTLKVLPWHWLYFFYSGVAFGYVAVNIFLLRPISGLFNPRKLVELEKSTSYKDKKQKKL